MDDCTAKRAARFNVPGRSSGLILRDTTRDKDQNVQFCTRLGCSGRINSMMGSHSGYSEKSKSVRTTCRYSSGKEIVGSSSRTSPPMTNSRNSRLEPLKKHSPQLESDSSETSSVQGDSEVLDLVNSPENVQQRFATASGNNEPCKVFEEAGCSNKASSTRLTRKYYPKAGLGDKGTSLSIASKSFHQSAKPSANTSRYNMKNLRCNSVSDVIATDCSSSDANLSRSKDTGRKRSFAGDRSSTSRGKNPTTGPMREGHSLVSRPGISISESRQTRNWNHNGENGVTSVRTRRSVNGITGTGLSSHRNNGTSSSESTRGIPLMPQPEVALGGDDASTSDFFGLETSRSCSGSFGQPGSSNDNLSSSMPTSPREASLTYSLINRDSFRRYNMDGIAEVLLALERIEHDEELSYEQLLVLETNLLLGGLSIHDQHRDMRLDIDNMTYEELLDLEEKMGTVSTALSEEALSKCLKRCIYKPKVLQPLVMGSRLDNDEVKCSICQEEYVDGDEMGKLECDHAYHIDCIHHWLRLKNWCPICKASAAPSLLSQTPSQSNE
ncbi:Zinc finger, RING-type [Dillenia turbinata]|uniref:RING-type E3 ubiquitin transferase n=1 Tax=Dillenia turbinata TaxID=194707 RepID=A0AAN8YTU0_9MAGN